LPNKGFPYQIKPSAIEIAAPISANTVSDIEK